jgi:hypothetical protein
VCIGAVQGSQVLLFLRPKEVDEPVAKEDSEHEAAAAAAADGSDASSSSSAPAPFVVPPIEQEHLDKALSVSLVTERTKVKLICTPETYALQPRSIDLHASHVVCNADHPS